MPAPAVRLRLFGLPALEQGGQTWPLPFERRSQLLVLLARRGGWVARAEAAALLWPGLDERQAGANLRKTLFRLGPTPWSGAVQSQAGALAFAGTTDLAAFEAALAGGRLDEALTIAGGPGGGALAVGFDDDANEAWSAWLRHERDRVRGAWRTAALEWLAGAVPPPAALAWSERLLESDPFDEAALGTHLGALTASGQVDEAHAAWEGFAARLHDELGLAPGASLLALRPGAARQVHPPSFAEGFVGRAAEMRRMASLLEQDDCRLLCILGPGGIGKTRLAERARFELACGFADGSLVVPLDDVRSSGEFGERLAGALGVPARGDALAQAMAALAGRRMLLLLDNAESLPDAGACLSRLLAAAPAVKLLVTSRVRPGACGEWLLALDGLPCPEDEDLDRFETFDAVRLFVQCVRRLVPDFAPAREAAAIVEICRLVEGLPLALEWAAAWVRVLSCAEIAAELREGSALLAGEDPLRTRRHASIEQVFEQSWQKLGPAERSALARLAVFRGGFTPAAARAVAGASMPELAALVDRSLVAKEGARLRLHALVQQGAAARLGAAREAALDAHAGWFLAWLAPLRSGAAHGARDVLQALDTEHENLRQAWCHAAQRGRAEALLASLPVLVDHWEHRARFEDGRAMLQAALDAPAGQDARLRPLLVGTLALMIERLGRYDDACALAAQALASAAPRDAAARYRALSVLGGCELIRGNPVRALGLQRRALAVARRSRPADLPSALDNLALVEKRLGHYEASVHLSLEALAGHRRHGDDARGALCLSNLGSIHMLLDENERAAACLEEARTIAGRLGLVSTLAFAEANLTELATKRGDFTAARRHAQAAHAVARRCGLRPLQGWLEVQLARAAAHEGDAGTAAAHLSQAATLALALGAPSVKAAVLLGLCELLELQGRATAARRVLAFAADEPALSVPDRDELRAEWARRVSSHTADAPWPALALDELLRRVVAEAPTACTALAALLTDERPAHGA